MKNTIFRHYDIRGIVHSEIMLDKVYALGQALAYYYIKNDPTVKRVIVGMDGRIHSSDIKEQLCSAFIDSGLNVLFIGVCPTPVMYFGLHTLPVDAGVMITASHNPAEYNGFKICLGKESVWGNEIQKLKEYYQQGKSIAPTCKGVYECYNLIPEYTATLVKYFEHLKGNDIRVIFDCGNGTAGAVLPLLVKKMKWSNAILLYEKIDGTYPNHEADPTVEVNMQDLKNMLQTSDAQLGIGFDGDADRMAAMTNDGYLVPGDTLLAIFAQYIFERMPIDQKCSTGVVFDIRSSQAVADLLIEWGVSSWRSPAGHASIKNDMKKHNALLGGELSCHFMFNDRYFGFDDGIYAAMRLIEIIVTTNAKLEEMVTVLSHTFVSPELRIEYQGNRQVILEDLGRIFSNRNDVEVITIDGIFVQFGDGWGLIRLSHTQPIISLRFEAKTQDALQAIKLSFFEILHPYFGNSLKRHLQL